MYVQLIESGGIAGKHKEYPILKITDQDIIENINFLIDKVNFFNLPSTITSPGADFLYTTITIEKNKLVHSVTTDFEGNILLMNNLRKLANYIKDLYDNINSSVIDVNLKNETINARVGDILNINYFTSATNAPNISFSDGIVFLDDYITEYNDKPGSSIKRVRKAKITKKGKQFVKEVAKHPNHKSSTYYTYINVR